MEPLIEKFFTKSAFDILRSSLNRLSEAELLFEEEWILALLGHVPLNEEKTLGIGCVFIEYNHPKI